jgi:hypothetical protein
MSDVMYSCTDVDTLTNTDPDEAIQEYLDHLEPEDWPQTITVMVYTRDVVSAKERQAFAERTLESLIEGLDEDYGSPDSYTDITPTMKAAAEAFVNAVLEDYNVWNCTHQQKDDIEEDTVAWIRKNCEHWLEEEKVVKRLKEMEDE